MSKIAVISPGYLWFPCEKGTTRIFDLCCDLTEAGHTVEAIVPDFQHFQKEWRDKKLILSQNYPFKITFVHCGAYKRNIGPGRIISNGILSLSIKKYLLSHIKEYDAVFVSLPPNNVAKEVSKICEDNGVPCVADIEDLWPEAMAMVIKQDSLRERLLSSFTKDAEETYSRCSAAVGTSPDYTARAHKKKKRDIPYLTAFVGVNITAFDKGVSLHKGEIERQEGVFYVTYAGSVSTSYDIKTLIDAAEILESTKFSDIKFKILGTGSELESLKAHAEELGLGNVEFMGFVPYEKMAAYLAASDVLINSFVKDASQSIVNKVGDYLAAGRPMINTLNNPVFTSIVEENGVGINIKPENPGALCDAILTLYNDRALGDEMGKRARRLCERDFDRKRSHGEIIRLINSLIEGKTL